MHAPDLGQGGQKSREAAEGHRFGDQGALQALAGERTKRLEFLRGLDPLGDRAQAEALAQAAGTTARVSAVPRGMIALGGIVVPVFRELKETWYQFAEAWTTDSSRTEAALGVRATPLADGAAATVAWWRSQPRA